MALPNRVFCLECVHNINNEHFNQVYRIFMNEFRLRKIVDFLWMWKCIYGYFQLGLEIYGLPYHRGT